MQLKNLFADEDAVSPVIGVILMVAITVILAAVIGAFVLGIGGSQTQTPQASWEWSSGSASGTLACDVSVDGSSSGSTFHVTHQGGDELESDNLAIGGTDCTDGNTVNAGTPLQVSDVQSDTTVSLVWKSPSSSDTSILSSYDA
ncbi:type IV pilin [Halorubellus salinus]|uniref:type IV pilin n=1 Tax=Halorubellus salinus TaxID=755309 RepID=UPI001D063CBC|nr:type IV pilin N-terminal domain-containing protein [Halorubellus salinus]